MVEKYSLTPEHEAQLYPWHLKWVDIALRTKLQTPEERRQVYDAVNGLYDAANLKRPEKIQFVPSPFVGAITAGFCAALYWHKQTGETVENTEATNDWLFKLAKKINPKIPSLMVACARNSWTMYSGGNMWAGGADYLSFFRHVVKLDIDFSKWAHYETCAMLSGFRWVHERFCIVSDFPIKLQIDNANRPHCSDGPSHAWADGFEIYHWHGYRIPDDKKWIINNKSEVTLKKILAEKNAELRRVMCEVVEFKPLLKSAKVISTDTDGNGLERRLLSVQLDGETIRLLEVQNGTLEPDGSRRKFILGALPGNSPHECVAASYGINPKYYNEAVRT